MIITLSLGGCNGPEYLEYNREEATVRQGIFSLGDRCFFEMDDSYFHLNRQENFRNSKEFQKDGVYEIYSNSKIEYLLAKIPARHLHKNFLKITGKDLDNKSSIYGEILLLRIIQERNNLNKGIIKDILPYVDYIIKSVKDQKFDVVMNPIKYGCLDQNRVSALISKSVNGKVTVICVVDNESDVPFEKYKCDKMIQSRTMWDYVENFYKIRRI